MKFLIYPLGLLILLVLFFSPVAAQNFGSYASAVWLTTCNENNFFNTSNSRTPADAIGPAANVFTGAHFGIHTQNSGSLILRGGEVKTFKTTSGNVCRVNLLYRVYPETGTPGTFTSIELPFFDDCNVSGSQFPSGGPCGSGDQKWQRVIPNGATSPAPINLTNFAPGNYVVELYYEIQGSNSSATACGDLITLNNGGANYRAFFTIQNPSVTGNNPTTCNGTEGSVTIGGLIAGSTYTLSYLNKGVPIGPQTVTANSSGQIIISNLNAGIYSGFNLQINGCTTAITQSVSLSNPVFTPQFLPIAPICSGAAAPILPTTSVNGFSGTWSPATVSNTLSGTYTFTPNAGQCTRSISIDVTVVPNTTPAFAFGTSLSICSGGIVPPLPATSQNGINGTWSPAVVSNTTGGIYTFTPTAGQCATATNFTVTVTPNSTPTFSFGNSLSICSGGSAPILPITSQNGITGSWSPATINTTTGGSYTFTPAAGQCANTTTLIVTINPTPTISPIANRIVLDGDAVPVTVFSGTPSGVSFTWTNNTPSIGLPASGTGNLPAFSAINRGNTDVVATITVTPVLNGCSGMPVTFTILVRALYKDVFVPNVFSPNGDGKNDRLQVYGNYITRLEMRIFNQWGEQVAFLNNINQGWDGTHRGKPQPVGVYTYALRAELGDGRTTNLKGAITLVR